MKIIVFDTGTGGKIFAQYLKKKHPKVEIKTLIDKKNSPYGNKGDKEIFNLTDKALEKYIGKGDIIVLACNTATAVAIDKLRQKYPRQVFIGFEPMIKPASKLTKTGKIMILATDATKKSKRYKKLKAQFPNVHIIEPKCGQWAELIDKGIFDQNDIKNALQSKLDGIDVIILACTHYIAISDEIKQVVGENINVINPFSAIDKQISRKLLDTREKLKKMKKVVDMKRKLV